MDKDTVIGIGDLKAGLKALLAVCEQEPANKQYYLRMDLTIKSGPKSLKEYKTFIRKTLAALSNYADTQPVVCPVNFGIVNPDARVFGEKVNAEYQKTLKAAQADEPQNASNTQTDTQARTEDVL